MSLKGSEIEAAVAKYSSVALLGIVSGAWFVAVNNAVLEPYLDEYFHIRQAIEYWKGNWHIWDPKITTPPGLYIVSWPWLLFLHRSKLPYALLHQLRAVNAVLGVPGIFKLLPGLIKRVWQAELEIIARKTMLRVSSDKAKAIESEADNEHAAAVWETTRNVTFFPPLFFFSALYYTDVISVLLILCCYRAFHSQAAGWGVLPLGLASLFFRQNNIFWCAIYLAGLEVTRTLQSNTTDSALVISQVPEIIKASWVKGVFHDPNVDVANILDYILSVVTLAIAAVINLPRLVIRLLPYVILLALFGGFVLWNGGVVLGDKSNHVASLHLPQMLYIWAYVAFFSLPVLLLAVTSKLAASAAYVQTQPKASVFSLLKTLPSALFVIVSLPLSLAAVRYNTIIHPFTLSDNRHYTFYVFRILRLHHWLWYAAVPVYLGAAWAAIAALGTGKGDARLLGIDRANESSQGVQDKAPAEERVPGNRVSFVVIWLVSSALGLVTAPLVEPRYFILPWIIWRIHVPPSSMAVPVPALMSEKMRTKQQESHMKISAAERQKIKNIEEKSAKEGRRRNESLTGFQLRSAVKRYADSAPGLETLWLLGINATTMYVFVNWGFEWPQEPGKVQRFMW